MGMTLRDDWMREEVIASSNHSELPINKWLKKRMDDILTEAAKSYFTVVLTDKEKLKMMQELLPSANPLERRFYEI